MTNSKDREYHNICIHLIKSKKTKRSQTVTKVSICEVGPRDGLQSEPELLSTQVKKEFITRGLDSDQTVSAIKATEKMLNII